MSLSANVVKFLVLCLIWGLNWIAVKVGIDTVPPLLFAATRFVVAGLLLSLWACRSARLADWRKAEVGRLFAASLLFVTLCHGPLFWGMQYVTSGTAAVVEMSLTPIALLGFGIALGQERWNWANALAIGLGVVGLGVLFAPVIGADVSGLQPVVGLVAVAWAALSYSCGSVLARPLVMRRGSAMLSGTTMLIGGLALLAPAFVLEPEAARSLTIFWGWPALAGWLFLVVFGSVVGFNLYMQLLRDIGPAKAGSFAFVSPAIAVLVGMGAAGESASLQDVAGMAMMLLAAGACLYSDLLERIGVRIARNVHGLA